MPQAVSNRVKTALVREVTIGTTPATPKWLPLRFNGGSLTAKPRTVISDEIISDRMVSDLILVGKDTDGSHEIEFSYYRSLKGGLDLVLEGALAALWTKTAEKDNDGTADSAITDVSATAITTTAASPAWAALMLLRNTGFAAAGNNRLLVAAAGTTSTSIVITGGTVDTTPAAAARIKCIGVQGASGDITATTSTGNALLSTALNWTTAGFNLQVGQWILVGTNAARADPVTGDVFSFPNAAKANNGWARISLIAATRLDLDRTPTGWVTDPGTAKTIRVYFGDTLRNGTTTLGHSIEQQHPDLAAPAYQLFKGMVVDTLSMSLSPQAIVKGSIGWKGMSGGFSTTRFAGSTDGTAESSDVMNSSSNVARLAENGVTLADPVYALEMMLNIANNLRQLPAVGTLDFIGVNMGRNVVSGSAKFYFGDLVILNKALAATATSLDYAIQDSAGMTYQVDLPKVKLATAQAVPSGIDTDITVDCDWQALKYTPPSGSAYQIQIERCELAGTAA